MFSKITPLNIQWIWYVLTAIACAFMLLPIGIQLIGEESVYAVILQNMIEKNNYGDAFYRPPLFLWASASLSHLLNLSSIELPLRLASIISSICAAMFAAIFAHKVFKQDNAGIIAALIFLMLGEIQFWYGWLGYADAMFLFFIFSAMVSTWLAAQFKQVRWYALAILLINAAFLTKALTAYVFFASTLIITAWGFHSWRFFLKPINIILSVLSIAAPIIWMQVHNSGSNASSNQLIQDIVIRFNSIDVIAYIKHLITTPLEFFLRMMPLSFLVAWFIFRKQPAPTQNKEIRLIALILLINALPYWLAPFSSMRHIVPLYGWASLLLSYYFLQLNFQAKKIAIITIVITLFLKIIFSIWVLPFLKERDDSHSFKHIASDVIQITQAQGLSTIRRKSETFAAYAITAYINEMRPRSSVIQVLQNDEHHVYVLEFTQPANAKLIKTYTPFNSPVYLYYLE